MSDNTKPMQGTNAEERKIDLEAGRRAFIKAVGLGGAASALAVATVQKASAQTTAADYDVAILNFALNLEYLEAQFYQLAAYGVGLPSSYTSGLGTLGGVIGGRKVNFSNPIVADYAAEIATDEKNHVAFLRSALGNQAVSQPQLDIANAFTVAAQAAGVVPASGFFDAYANDVNFLLAAYIFEDVGVTAYHGAAPFITNKAYLAAAAGILAVEAYHAGLIRTFLFAQQSSAVSMITDQISALRATLSGAADDQGIDASQSTLGGGFPSPVNIVPADANSIAYARTPRQVLNVVYGQAGASHGLFFPNGVNGGPGGAALVKAAG